MQRFTVALGVAIVSLFVSACFGQGYLAGGSRQCPSNDIFPACRWRDPDNLIWESVNVGSVPVSTSWVRLSSRYTTYLYVADQGSSPGTSVPYSATQREVSVGFDTTPDSGEKITLDIISGSTLTVTETLILIQDPLITNLGSETIVSGTLIVQQSIRLGAKLTVNNGGQVQLYGTLVPKNYSSAYGLAELNLIKGGNIVAFGPQDWIEAAKFTIGGGFQFFSLGGDAVVSLGGSSINVVNGSLSFEFGCSLALPSTGTITVTGFQSSITQDTQSTIKPVIGGKLNNTAGRIVFSSGLDFNSTGSYYQSGGSITFGREVNLSGLMNITGGTFTTGLFQLLVLSGGRFWTNQAVNISQLVVSAGGQATFMVAPNVLYLSLSSGGTVTAAAPLNLIGGGDFGGTFTGSASLGASSILRAGATVAGTLTVSGNLTASGVINSPSTVLTLQSQSFLKINFDVDRLNVQSINFGSARLDLTDSTTLPTVSGTKWTFATFSSYTGSLNAAVVLPAGTTNTYTIVYEPAGGPFTSVAVQMTVPPPVAPVPVAAPVRPPVAVPVAPAPALAPVSTPVAAPVSVPTPASAPAPGSTPVPAASPVDSSAPVAAPVGSSAPVAAPVDGSAPVAAPIGGSVPVAAPVVPQRSLTLAVTEVLNSTQQNDLKATLAAVTGANTADISLSGSGVSMKRADYVVVATFSGSASAAAFDAYFSGNLTQKAFVLQAAIQNVASLAGTVSTVVVPTQLPPVASPSTAAVPQNAAPTAVRSVPSKAVVSATSRNNIAAGAIVFIISIIALVSF